MTYKAAWEALQNMNNLSDETLIQTSKGDNQNGTKLTAYAKDLIRAHKEVMKYHALLNKELERNLLSKNFNTLRRITMQLSARNILVARVAGLTKSDVNTLVELDLGGVRLTSTITTSAALGLDLKPGDEVKAIFKSSSVMVSTAKDLAISARNIISGKIVQLTVGDVNAEVVLELSPKDRVVSVITSNSAKALSLETGKTCFAVIKSSEIMIGK